MKFNYLGVELEYLGLGEARDAQDRPFSAYRFLYLNPPKGAIIIDEDLVKLSTDPFSFILGEIGAHIKVVVKE